MNRGDKVLVVGTPIPNKMPINSAYKGCGGTIVDFYENSPKVLVDLIIRGGVYRVPIAQYYLRNKPVEPT